MRCFLACLCASFPGVRGREEGFLSSLHPHTLENLITGYKQLFIVDLQAMLQAHYSNNQKQVI